MCVRACARQFSLSHSSAGTSTPQHCGTALTHRRRRQPNFGPGALPPADFLQAHHKSRRRHNDPRLGRESAGGKDEHISRASNCGAATMPLSFSYWVGLVLLCAAMLEVPTDARTRQIAKDMVKDLESYTFVDEGIFRPVICSVCDGAPTKAQWRPTPVGTQPTRRAPGTNARRWSGPLGRTTW